MDMGGLPASLITAVGVQVSCQLFKLIFYSIRDHKLSIEYFFTAGGMPSAHAAFVTALTVATGMRGGIASEVFAVACVFSTIVIYDAYRLRGHVERQGKLLNRLIADYHPEERERVPEMVGHSIGEIAIGCLYGGGLAATITLIVRI